MDVNPAGGIVRLDQTTLSPYPVTSTILSGTSVQLEAIPAPGYQFDGWSGDMSGSSNPATISIDCNKVVTAHFSLVTYTLIVQVNGSGSTNPTVGSHSYTHGNTASIKATPEKGWQFTGWTGDVEDPDSAEIILTIDSDKTITANFSQDKPSWWLIGSSIAGAIVIVAIIWLAVKSRTALNPAHT